MFCLRGHLKSTYAHLHRFLDLSPCTLSYVFEVFPPPERTYFKFISPSEHLNGLFISVSSKFGTFDTYLIPPKLQHICVKIIIESAVLRLQCSTDNFTYLGFFASIYFLKVTRAYVRSLKNPPLVRFRALSWVPPPPFQNVRTF